MEGGKDITKLDKKKLLRADERRRRANDEYGDIEKYLSSDSDQSQEGSEDESTDESDAEEDTNGELITPEIDAQILKALTALRSKDKSIYDPNVNFFSEDSIQRSQSAWKAKQKQKRDQSKEESMTLRDYQHKIMVEHGGVVDEEKELKKVTNSGSAMTHVEEQEALKSAFKDAVLDGQDEEDDLLVKKEKTEDEISKEDEEYRQFLLDNIGGNTENNKAVDNWAAFTSERESVGGTVDANQAFLMNYILNRGWIDNSEGKNSDLYEAKVLVDKEEDDKYTELADNFESKHNFRFEEQGGGQIQSHPRIIEGSMRRKDDRRKLARERAKERKAERKKEKTEELKRIKNQKKKDILSKLKEIQGITGNSVVGFDKLDLDGDFDPAKFDSQMDEMFGDDSKFDPDAEKPVWDDDIDVDGMVSNEDEGMSKKKKGKKGKEATPIDIGNDDFIMDADYLDGSINNSGYSKADSEQLSLSKDQLKDKVSDYMDKHYQLDFEDMIGDDLPTRFKYAKVKPVNYGLSAAEILLADDQHLNEYFSAKKIATYRPDWKIDDDLSKHANKKRLKYVQKKAAKRRAEWDGNNSDRQSSIAMKTKKRVKAQSSDTNKPVPTATKVEEEDLKGLNRRQRKKARKAKQVDG